MTESVKPFEKVIVHPLVLLSVVDHFNRMKQVGNTKRVVGVLLGSLRNKILDISNSFAGNFNARNTHSPRRLCLICIQFYFSKKCPSTRKTKTKTCGFSTTNTSRTCILCSKKLTVSLIWLVFLAQNVVVFVFSKALFISILKQGKK